MIERWLDWLRIERGALPSTRRAYERDVRKLAERGDPVLMRTDDLRAFLAGSNGAASTVARRIAALRSFYRFLARAGVREDDPTATLDRPKVRRGLPKPVRGFQGALDALKDDETRAIARFIVETGVRISEACQVAATLPVPEELTVVGKGAKERVLLLTDEARAALSELGGRVRLSPRTIQRRFRAAGFTPHQLRHTFACDLAEGGADLGEMQDLLGHASPATTRIYAGYSRDRLRRALERRPKRG